MSRTKSVGRVGVAKKNKTLAKTKSKESAKKTTSPKNTVRTYGFTQIIKRDGSIAPFSTERIEKAVEKALNATGEFKVGLPKEVSDIVVAEMTALHAGDKNFIPSVEEVQDNVEKALITKKLVQTAKSYILYRQRHAEMRSERGIVPDHVRELVTEGKKYFQNQLAEYVFYTTYSKWLPEEGRRETWVEAVSRYLNFMKQNLQEKITDDEIAELRENMLRMNVVGSQRLLWSAGPAADKSNVCAYNCAFVAPSKWQDFGEIMYILACGTGMGFSVERQNTERLPMIQKQTGEKLPTHVIGDSKEDWADALVLGLKTWSEGKDVTFDYSDIRPAGARLKTMGGRASGPEPLRALLDFSREKMFKNQNRRLKPIDVHDIICKIGEVIVAGGVRRSALISLSDLDDVEMRDAKNGQFYVTHPERSMANNSVAYNEKPTMEEFLNEWHNLVTSGSGERGIYNRGSLKNQLPVRRWSKFEKDSQNCGVNPCGEIILKSKQFCNLTEVVARSEDTEETLLEKVRLAAILGTYQSSLTKFRYLSKEWKENCEEEALLGISITGQWDSPVVRKPNVLRKLKEMAIETNREYAKRFGVNPSTAITCVKPSGNTSQLTNASSGMHPRHAKFYIRRVRVQAHDPIFQMIKDAGVPYNPEVGQPAQSASTYVLEFPVKAPRNAIVKDDISAAVMLEHWRVVKENYTEHNPSVTVSVSGDEWLKVGDWVYENWDMIGGLSFLPRNDHVYKLAPYEEISEERYNELANKFPELDFSKIVLYEKDDEHVKGSKELACVAGTCEIEIPVGQEKKEKNK